ncbi:MAG: hypothetical protein IKW10_08345 [Oscillospiraceae bacterium]|nr:hypothetical protein [Oscillospiraceae bacterium]
MRDTQIQEILLALQGELIDHPWKDIVPNLFAEGMPCAELYEAVYDANCRLCKRLGDLEEDEDVETIISNLLKIAEMQSIEMFRCGWKFAKENIEM